MILHSDQSEYNLPISNILYNIYQRFEQPTSYMYFCRNLLIYLTLFMVPTI